METMSAKQERVIDIKQVCVAVFRKWRILAVVVLVLAVAMGALEITSHMSAASVPVMSEQQIQEAKDLIEANELSIKDCENWILNAQEDIVVFQENLTEYKRIYENALKITPLTPEAVTVIMDLTTKIVDVEENITDAQRGITAKEKNIEALKKMNEEQQEKLDMVIDPSISVSSVIKKAVVGAVLGVVLVCAVIFLFWLCDSRIRSVEELKQNYGVSVLGRLFQSETLEVYKKHRGIDRWIDQWDGVDVGLDAQMEYAAVAAKLEILVGPRKQLLITGTLDDTKLKLVQEKLRASFSTNEIEMMTAGNLTHNKDGILQIPNSMVLLVEAIGETKAKEFGELLELLKRSNGEIAGVLVLQ